MHISQWQWNPGTCTSPHPFILILFIPNRIAYMNTSWWITSSYLSNFQPDVVLLRPSTFLLISTLFLFYITLHLIIHSPTPKRNISTRLHTPLHPYQWDTLPVFMSLIIHHSASHTIAYCNCNPPQPVCLCPIQCMSLSSLLACLLCFPHHQHLYNTPFLTAAAALLGCLTLKMKTSRPLKCRKLHAQWHGKTFWQK